MALSSSGSVRAVRTFIVQITAKTTGPIRVPQRCPHPKLWRMYVTFQGQRYFAGVIKVANQLTLERKLGIIWVVPI